MESGSCGGVCIESRLFKITVSPRGRRLSFVICLPIVMS